MVLFFQFGFSLILIQYFIYMKFKASQHQCIVRLQANAGEKGRRWWEEEASLGTLRVWCFPRWWLRGHLQCVIELSTYNLWTFQYACL